MDPRIERIRSKIATQGVRVGPSASEEILASFEKEHAIVLPPAFREFLLHVGNGGAGPPAYGLLRLGEVPTDMPPDQAAIWRDLPIVTQPFPFTRTWVWEDGDTSPEGNEEQVEHGSICLGNDGCAMYWHLVVTGPERGNVWLLTGEGIQPTTPRRDFLRWYEDWLDGRTNWWADPE